MSEDAACVSPTTPFQELMKQLLALPRGHDLYVCTPDRELLGAVVLDDLKGTIPDAANLSMILAADVMDRRPPVRIATKWKTRAQGAADVMRFVKNGDRIFVHGSISIRAILRRGAF